MAENDRPNLIVVEKHLNHQILYPEETYRLQFWLAAWVAQSSYLPVDHARLDYQKLQQAEYSPPPPIAIHGEAAFEGTFQLVDQLLENGQWLDAAQICEGHLLHVNCSVDSWNHHLTHLQNQLIYHLQSAITGEFPQTFLDIITIFNNILPPQFILQLSDLQSDCQEIITQGLFHQPIIHRLSESAADIPVSDRFYWQRRGLVIFNYMSQAEIMSEPEIVSGAAATVSKFITTSNYHTGEVKRVLARYEDEGFNRSNLVRHPQVIETAADLTARHIQTYWDDYIFAKKDLVDMTKLGIDRSLIVQHPHFLSVVIRHALELVTSNDSTLSDLDLFFRQATSFSLTKTEIINDPDFIKYLSQNYQLIDFRKLSHLGFKNYRRLILT